jgi:hypothetical protein
MSQCACIGRDLVSITTASSRAFTRDVPGAKRAATKGPPFITDRGRPAPVLLTYEAYRALTGQERRLLDRVAQDDDIAFDPPCMGDDISRPVGLG